MSEGEEKDFFRDTSARYLGYANEIGESFRALVRRSLVHSSYVVSCGYVFADAVSKSLKPKNAPYIDRVVLFSDAVMWQSLASVAIPGITINRICAVCGFGLRKTFASTSLVARNWVCTFIGLLAIPFIIHPIDRGVDYAMNHTVRKVYSITERETPIEK